MKKKLFKDKIFLGYPLNVEMFVRPFGRIIITDWYIKRKHIYVTLINLDIGEIFKVKDSDINFAKIPFNYMLKSGPI